MEYVSYPLPILHHYTVKRAEMLGFLRYISEIPPKKLGNLKGLPENREKTAAINAVVLEELINATETSEIIFSAAGIREGILFKNLSQELKETDAFDASLSRIENGLTSDRLYASTLFNWMSPLFGKESPRDEHLRRSFCRISDIALPIHNEFRAEWAFRHIVESSLWGITHNERIKLALALYYRYRHRKNFKHRLLDLISEKEQYQARVMGLAASLAFECSGGVAELLQESRLAVDEKNVYLSHQGSEFSLISESANKKLENLQKSFCPPR